MIGRVEIKMADCGGIRKLEEQFNFTDEKSTISIYAANGSMKTSFANTLDEYSSNDGFTENPYFKDRIKDCTVSFDGSAAAKESIKVIKPFSDKYDSDGVSTLLVNDELRKRYQELTVSIKRKREALLGKIATATGIRGQPHTEEEINKSFGKDSLVENLQEASNSLDTFRSSLPSGLNYRDIFTKKIEDILEKKEVKEQLVEYLEAFNEISQKSPYLRGGFTIYQLQSVAEELKTQKYFEAGHDIKLANDINPKAPLEVTSIDRLQEVIRQQKLDIWSDPELIEKWDKATAAFSTKEGREFRDLIDANPDYRPHLADLPALRKGMMLIAIEPHKADLEIYLAELDAVSKELGEIEQKAKDEVTEWRRVIDIFERRFSLPVIVDIDDKTTTILGNKSPEFTFEFECDATGEKAPCTKPELFKHLSLGERRALYLLDVIYDIEARRINFPETLYVIDDIADSFDYKNKYAIIEYLHDVVQHTESRMLVLTHNFDFHRSICSRFGLRDERKLLASRTKGLISLSNDPFGEDLFKGWRDELKDNGGGHHNIDRKMLASIALVRNIAGYRGDTPSKRLLTNILHDKPAQGLIPATGNITIANIGDVFRDVLKFDAAWAFSNPTGIVVDILTAEADKILGETDESIELESKVVLSMAIRLSTEGYVIDKINDPSITDGIRNDRWAQTGRLCGAYKTKFSTDHDVLKILDRVQIMTPESIHLNSFMYEPILDMSNVSLKQLYNDVKNNLK